MCDIRRLQKLKGLSKRFFGSLKDSDPLSFFPPSYVSDTGLTRSDIQEKIDKVSSCSTIVELKEDFVQQGETFEQILKVVAANYCKQPTVCPVCANRVQSRRHVRYSDVIREQARMVEAGSRFAYIVTYTITDGGDLSERLEKLRDTKKKFRLMGQRRKNRKTGKVWRSGGEFSKICAGLSSTEIKRGENSEEWHVHNHDLVFTDERLDFKVYDSEIKRKLHEKYGNNIPKDILDSAVRFRADFKGEALPVSKISSEWLKASGGDSISVHVAPVRHIPKKCSAKRKRKLRSMSFEDSVLYQAKEILTYMSKLNPNETGDVLQILEATYNKRMIDTFGEFRGVKGNDYEIETTDADSTFVIVWDDQSNTFGNPLPGKVRDVLEDEKAIETRKRVGQVLGQYRRERKRILENRETYGDSLSNYLDTAKKGFKRRIAALWSLYHQSVSSSERMTAGRCDKYSPVMAVAGAYIPGSDSRDIYAAAFT